jgi:hypothetical protein
MIIVLWEVHCTIAPLGGGGGELRRERERKKIRIVY